MIGMVTLFYVIDWSILIADAVWVTYRIVKGYLNLADGKQMYGAEFRTL